MGRQFTEPVGHATIDTQSRLSEPIIDGALTGVLNDRVRELVHLGRCTLPSMSFQLLLGESVSNDAAMNDEAQLAKRRLRLIFGQPRAGGGGMAAGRMYKSLL